MKSGKLPISSDEVQCWNIHSYDTDCEETKVQDDWQSPHNVIQTSNMRFIERMAILQSKALFQLGVTISVKWNVKANLLQMQMYSLRCSSLAH